jgi:hypothetical protein
MISSKIYYQSMGLCYIHHTLVLHRNIQSLPISNKDRISKWISKQNKRRRIHLPFSRSSKLSLKEEACQRRISGRHGGILMVNTNPPSSHPHSSMNKSIDSHKETQEPGEPQHIEHPYILTSRRPSSNLWNINSRKTDSVIYTSSKLAIDIWHLNCSEGILH